MCFAILSEVSLNTTRDGKTWEKLSPEIIAERLRISLSTVFVHLAHVEEAGHLMIDRHRPGARSRGGRLHNEFALPDSEAPVDRSA